MARELTSPLDLFDRLSRDFGLLRHSLTLPDLSTESALAEWRPDVDVEEKDDRYIVTLDLPGVSAKDVEVTYDDNVLTIKGSREEEQKEERKGYLKVERSKGSFMRQFRLPSTHGEDVTASTENGVLTVVVPKAPEAKPRRIDVK